MIKLCSDCGHSSVTEFECYVCPLCKYNNAIHEYKKGDKFHVLIQGRESYFRYVDEVLDHLKCNFSLEFDNYVLSCDLKSMDKYDSLELRHDCIIQRIH